MRRRLTQQGIPAVLVILFALPSVLPASQATVGTDEPPYGAWVTSRATPYYGWDVELALDSAGEPHIGHADHIECPSLCRFSTAYHLSRGLTGWTREVIARDGLVKAIVEDSHDVLHAGLLVLPPGQTSRVVEYATRNTNGTWSRELIDNATNYVRKMDVKLDAQDRPHVMYDSGSAVKYATQSTPGGPWTNQTVLSGAGYYSWLTMGVDSAGLVHFAVSESGTNALIYGKQLSNGTFVTEVARSQCNFGSLALDPQDLPHIACAWNGFRYLSRASNGTWADERIQDANDQDFSLAMDSKSRPHIVFHYPPGPLGLRDPIQGPRLGYVTKTANGWTTEEPFRVASLIFTPALVLDKQDRPHIAFEVDAVASQYFGQNPNGIGDGGIWYTEPAIAANPTAYPAVAQTLAQAAGLPL